MDLLFLAPFYPIFKISKKIYEKKSNNFNFLCNLNLKYKNVKLIISFNNLNENLSISDFEFFLKLSFIIFKPKFISKINKNLSKIIEIQIKINNNSDFELFKLNNFQNSLFKSFC